MGTLHRSGANSSTVILSYQFKCLNRFKFTIYQKKNWSGTSENSMSSLLWFVSHMIFPCTGRRCAKLHPITHLGVISLSSDRTWWTHACIFMRLPVKAHTEACANKNHVNHPSLTRTNTHAHTRTVKLLNPSTSSRCRHSLFKLIIPLLILCQYSSFFHPPPPSPVYFVRFPVRQVIAPHPQTSIEITSSPAKIRLQTKTDTVFWLKINRQTQI